jgi:pimeloyl-ACP methyl ester carboxylesterase
MPAPPLLLLPGLLEDADAFEQQVYGLAEQAACVVADLTRADTMASLAEQALAQAPADAFALAGHSMGGYVALELMRQAPERVRRLALIATNARPDSPAATSDRQRLMRLAETDFPAVALQLLPRLVSPAHLERQEIAGKVTEMALATGKEAFLRQQRAIIGRIDSRPHLAAIRCRTLVVAASEDALMPMEALREIADGIPGACFATIEDSGHMVSLEQPEALTRLLRSWLA